jgi:GMP synthase (glutamine-hydrolysing)
MMFLIIQTGDPVKLAVDQFGGFADWFIRDLGIKAEQALVVNVHQGQLLPDIKTVDLSAVIVTGSASMVTEHTDWMLYTQKWLESALAKKTPTMGVCFGHQLLADLLGGQVDYNLNGRNMGVSACHLNDAGKNDILFSGLSQSNSFNTFVSHQQSVQILPKSVTLLGSCELDKNHVFRYQNHVWGVQFHPEWNQDIMRTYIQQRKSALMSEGFDPDLMQAQLEPCPEAESLLAKFALLAGQPD